MNSHKRIPTAFYATSHDSEPVREWLLSLGEDDRRIVGFDIATVEFGWPIGMPVCRSFGKGLWEIRSNISSGRITRVIFVATKNHIVLLHAFIKKTQKTSKPDLDLDLDLDLALKRKREITS